MTPLSIGTEGTGLSPESFNEEQTMVPVVIRVSRNDPSDVFALFPTEPFDRYGHYCTCYQHVGQHSSADYHGCIRTSRPAIEAEARPLLAELRRIGYRLRVLKRAPRRNNPYRWSNAISR